MLVDKRLREELIFKGSWWQIPLLQGILIFFLLRLSTDCIRPTHIMEGNMLTQILLI
jgi:hypothetical protein